MKMASPARPQGDNLRLSVPLWQICKTPASRSWDASTPEPRPLVVMPHGGPHSCTRLAYSAPMAFLASLGYAVLAPNYRGSTGFGADALASLPGNCGTQDVEDVIACTRAFLDDPEHALDRGRVAVVGGSHGGFLGAWLVAAAPDLFRAAALRNPVTNIATMVGVTDIPDWCAVEAGARDANAPPASPETLATLFRASPASKIDAIDAPVLVAVGLKDRRVPPSQGIEFYHALKKRGKDASLLVYEHDDHALDTQRTNADHWVEIASFLEAHLGGASKEAA